MLPSGAPLSDWLTWLLTLSLNEINLGLERVNVMLERLKWDRPDYVLLIAGTNGKGSSVAMSAALLQACGKRVGVHTSPHIQRYNERIVVNAVEASDFEIVAAFERIEALRDGMPLTYFEFTTLAAVVIFAARDLDVWILEVGLGGRLDATNAIDPSASLINNISLDHCAWLGDDVEAIALEKAGVMRAGIPTVFGNRNMPKAIERHAAEIGANLLVAGQDFGVVRNDDGTWNWRDASGARLSLRPPGLAGEFQIDNAAAVLALLDAAGLGEELDADRVNAVLPELKLPGRMQHCIIDNVNWLFDVAHNPAAASVLAETLRSDSHRDATVAIIGVLDDKDIDGLVAPLADCVDHWIAVTAASDRAIPANELARRIANRCNRPCLVSRGFPEAVEFARRTASENDRILVTGSFHTVGPVIEYVRPSSQAKLSHL